MPAKPSPASVALKLGGSLRRSHLRYLIPLFVLSPNSALAQSCAVMRPDWIPGTKVSAVSEAILLFSNPIVLILLLASAVAIRFKSKWGALVLVVLWTVITSVLAFTDFGGRAAGIAEGCVGSASLFIAVVAALSVAMILYTSPKSDPR